MRPILLEWRRFKIHSYPALLYIGMVAGMFASAYAADQAGLDAGRVLLATLILIVPALIGSRLLFVATHWDHYRRTPRRIWRRSEGGAAMLGGLVFACAISVPLLRALRLPFAQFWDVSTFMMIIGLFFTRFGCLLHGCCSGCQTDGWLALCLPNHRGVWRRRIPMQLVEALLAVVLFSGALWIWNEPSSSEGVVFLTTVFAYSLARFFLEPLREDQDHLGRISVQRAITTALCAATLAGLWLAPRSGSSEVASSIAMGWFVPVAPLALLPALIPFAVIGCVVDRTGAASAISVIYDNSLAPYGAQTIKIEASGSFSVPDQPQFANQVDAEITISPMDDNGGSVQLGVVTLTATGDLTCACTITTADGQQTISATQHKPADEELEPFYLAAGPSGLHLGYGFALHG